MHVLEVDGWVEHETELIALSPAASTAEESAIAGHATALVEPGSTLQFGIGAVPDGMSLPYLVAMQLCAAFLVTCAWLMA